jgi:hypothetical protein
MLYMVMSTVAAVMTGNRFQSRQAIDRFRWDVPGAFCSGPDRTWHFLLFT